MTEQTNTTPAAVADTTPDTPVKPKRLRDMTADELRTRADQLRTGHPHTYLQLQSYRNTMAALRRIESTEKESTNMATATPTRPRIKNVKPTAASQGFPAAYLGPNGNFRPGLDARAKSDLRAAVAGKRTGKELHRFTKATALKLLAARGW